MASTSNLFAIKTSLLETLSFHYDQLKILFHLKGFELKICCAEPQCKQLRIQDFPGGY